MQAVGTENFQPYYLSLLAGAYGKAGQPEVGLTLLEEALAKVNANDERWSEADLHRLRGSCSCRKHFQNRRRRRNPVFLKRSRWRNGT